MGSPTTDPRILDEAVRLLSSGVSQADVSRRLGINRCTLTRRLSAADRAKYGTARLEAKQEKKRNLSEKQAQISDKKQPERLEAPTVSANHAYQYNEMTGQYIFAVTGITKPVVLGKTTVESMLRAYSKDGEGATINQMCRTFNLRRNVIVSVMRALGHTHDSLPFTAEELAARKDEELAEEIRQMRQGQVYSKIEKEKWDDLKEDAHKWRRFQHSVLAELKGLEGGAAYTVPKLHLPKGGRKYLVVVSPTDAHWGKRADAFEVGEDDNRTMQRERLLTSTTKVLGDVLRHGTPERILVGIGSDFLNIDNDLSGTTSGTPQDCDGNPAEIMATGFQMMREFIDTLRQVAPVETVLMSGNHDRLLGVALMLYLAAWYRNTPDVTVRHNSASPRAYVEYGTSLLCFNHSDTVPKTSDLARLAAIDKPREWGRCAHRMVFTGHLHSLKVEEDRGFTRMQLPSLSGRDRWHDRHGYIGSRSQLAAVLVDRTDGLFGTLYADGE